ncbi:SDR family NAD(P)-dependent oxidoreductase [Glycomyces mayteni]|uniref:SDR family NAD(P)-dependent oxidoreductase n=1 Tax=Glycomyces mayteni TaxID=543887 RepID=A0ABW2D900_9ACTN|nr:glucose 1-dehydrogenase [Glycomyces mayteni]
MSRLDGKTALITGAANGIGYAVAARFAAEGARVVVADRDGEAAAAAAGRIGDRARAVTVDIADEAVVMDVFAELDASGWAPDAVVANAAVQLIGEDAPIADLNTAVWRRTMEVNLTGTFITVKHAVRSMLRHGGGSIVLTGSPTGLSGEGSEFAAYSTSKAGVHGLARTAAATYAPNRIRVNTVVPTYTETSLTAALADDAEARDAIIGRIPLGRPGTPADVEGIMVFLASDESAFATGSLFAVDGGMSAL